MTYVFEFKLMCGKKILNSISEIMRTSLSMHNNKISSSRKHKFVKFAEILGTGGILHGNFNFRAAKFDVAEKNLKKFYYKFITDVEI